MNFVNYKNKLVVSVCLLQSEKERIKEILIAYNIRLTNIFNSISSILDDLEKINFIEQIPEEKERILNLINYVNNFSNIEEEEEIKKQIDEKFKNIDELKKMVSQTIILIYIQINLTKLKKLANLN